MVDTVAAHRTEDAIVAGPGDALEPDTNHEPATGGYVVASGEFSAVDREFDWFRR